MPDRRTIAKTIEKVTGYIRVSIIGHKDVPGWIGFRLSAYEVILCRLLERLVEKQPEGVSSEAGLISVITAVHVVVEEIESMLRHQPGMESANMRHSIENYVVAPLKAAAAGSVGTDDHNSVSIVLSANGLCDGAEVVRQMLVGVSENDDIHPMDRAISESCASMIPGIVDALHLVIDEEHSDEAIEAAAAVFKASMDGIAHQLREMKTRTDAVEDAYHKVVQLTS